MPVVNQRNLYFAFVFLSSLIPTSVLATTLAWQGPYGGVYLGGGMGDNHISTNVGGVTATSYFTTTTDVNAVNNAGTWTNNPNSLIVGIQAGHDWVYKQMIYGIAFDYSALPFSSSNTTNNTFSDIPNQYSVHTTMQTNWLFTLRGRWGYQPTFSLPSLIYLTGGMAMTQLKVSNSFSDNSALAGTSRNSTSQNQIGWTAGAGIEVAVLDHVTLDVEYLYVSVPSVKTTGYIYNANGGFGIPAQSMNSPFSTTSDFNANVVKVGLNYRFDE